jgi:hypothetical protein
MGNYLYMRGMVKIKPEYVEIMRPRFGVSRSMPEDPAPWDDLYLPAEIKQLPQYQVLVNPKYHGDWVPHVDSGHASTLESKEEGKDYEDGGRMEYSEDGILDFFMGMKNQGDPMRNFVELLPHIADAWFVEEDISDTGGNFDTTVIYHHNPKGIELFAPGHADPVKKIINAQNFGYG